LTAAAGAPLRGLPRLALDLIPDLNDALGWRRRGGSWIFETAGRTPSAFAQIVPSIQVRPPRGAVLRIQLAADTERGWSKLCDVGWQGDCSLLPRRRLRAPLAAVQVDVLRLESSPRGWRLRFTATGSEPWRWPWGLAAVTWRGRSRHPRWRTPPSLRRRVEITLPRCSQMAEGGRRGAEACSAATVQMLLAHRGVRVPLPRVMRTVHDPLEDIFGNWQQSIGAAWRFGCPGVLCYFRHWDQVLACLRAGTPIGASIKFPPGQVELPGAPIEHSGGHLVVVRGLTPDGWVLTNDPAAKSRIGVCRRYPVEAFSRAWFGFSGMGYLVFPRAH
jgi:hypothetical protein